MKPAPKRDNTFSEIPISTYDMDPDVLVKAREKVVAAGGSDLLAMLGLDAA